MPTTSTLRRTGVSLVPAMIAGLVVTTCLAAEDHALLIGIQDYKMADDLNGVLNDVQVLGDTLAERGGYQIKSVLDSAADDRATTFSARSERDCLQDAIAEWLSYRQSDDTVLLYFSGHGFRDAENRMYLAAKDCDPRNPEPGGVPLSWLRQQLVDCPARAKLLILDACHAGSARSTQTRSGNVVTAKDLGRFFEQTEGLVTLAACRGEQSSYLWPEKRHSIFTYWLIQGLCGHADREPLGEITVNELDDFVTRKVRTTAEALGGLSQVPIRLQGPNVTRDILLRLKPISLEALLDDMAEQMDVLVRLQGIDRVGVLPQFTSGPTLEVIDDTFGSLATYCPVGLTNRLATKGDGSYRVLSTNAVREALRSQDIRPKDVGTARTRNIAIDGRSLSSLVVGRVISLRSGVIALQCRLLDLSTGDLFGLAGGTARLNGPESAMQGISGASEPAAPIDHPDFADGLRPVSIDISQGHPLRDPNFQYRAWIVVKQPDGKFAKRSLRFQGNDAFVTLPRGEIFNIHYVNQSDRPVFARILVDGLNTLPDRSQTKGIFVEPNVVDERRQAQPVNLATARAWGPLQPNQEYKVRGFYVRVGKQAEYDEFQMVDARDSLAAEAGYTSQMGLITVAFYEMQKKPEPPDPNELSGARSARDSAVGRGGRYQTRTDIYSGAHMPGRQLAVVHIRYGEE